MAKLSPEQQQQLEELTRLRDAPDDEPDDDGDEPDDGVIVLRGKRADDFLGALFGKKRSKKTAPAADGDDDQADGDDGDDDEPDEPEPDKKPRAGHRYFS